MIVNKYLSYNNIFIFSEQKQFFRVKDDRKCPPTDLEPGAATSPKEGRVCKLQSVLTSAPQRLSNLKPCLRKNPGR